MQILKKPLSALTVSGLSIVLITACSAPKQADNTHVNTDKKHITELQQVMRELDQVLHSSEHQNPLEYEDVQRRNALRLSTKIETSAVRMQLAAANYPHIQNDPKALQQYLSYIETFKQQGQVIQQLAQSYQLEQLPSAIRKLNGTCVACHSQFQNTK